MSLSELKETPGACKACGNSPVSHGETYVSQLLSLMAGALEFHLKDNALFQLLLRCGRFSLGVLQPGAVAIGASVGVVTFQHDPRNAASYRSQVIWEEAIARGISMEQFVIAGIPTDIYRARIQNKLHYFTSLPLPPRLQTTPYSWIDDKFLLKHFLRSHNIPVPRVFSVRTEAKALDAFHEIGTSVITKPRLGSRGRHTTTAISTERELRAGFQSAHMVCPSVCVEEYLIGPVCRGTVVGGVLEGFFQAYPPRVTGDGVSTVEVLVAKANAQRSERVEEIQLTDEHDLFLKRIGFARDSVVPEGVRIPLTHRTGRLFGGETRELLSTVHPRLKAYLEKAGKALEAPVIGFDLIIESPEHDPDAQKWGVIEANSLPFIDLHYLPLYGEPSVVAKKVWDLWASP